MTCFSSFIVFYTGISLFDFVNFIHDGVDDFHVFDCYYLKLIHSMSIQSIKKPQLNVSFFTFHIIFRVSLVFIHSHTSSSISHFDRNMATILFSPSIPCSLRCHDHFFQTLSILFIFIFSIRNTGS